MSVAASFREDPALKLQEWARDALGWIEDGVNSFSVVDWVLIALAAAAVYWVLADLWAMTRLGPIEVDALEHDSADAADVKALTGALREQLDRIGLTPPPAVPAGTPQVNLISAIEASSIPQGAFIAKLMELLPKPPRPAEYKVTGVLVGAEAADPAAGEPLALSAGPCGLTYWVRPSRDGSPLLQSVDGRATHRDALSVASSAIYLHISNDAIHAFPVWARWPTASSLEAYVRGCRLRRHGFIGDAVAELKYAARQAPFNALAPLQLANIYESAAPTEAGFERARVQVLALRSYLAIAEDWPVLVEARYRASVVAGGLATTYEDEALEPDDRERIKGQLALPGADDTPDGEDKLPDRLRDLASRESLAVLQLLRPWYALLWEGRLRNRFEPKSRQRRELYQTVSISKHCMRMRALLAESGRRRVEIWSRSAIVRIRHLGVGRAHLTWQAHYNACCFDALLLSRLMDLGSSQRSRERVCKRALCSLDTAFKEAGDGLSPSWVERDPDQAVFRKSCNAEWQRLVKRGSERARGRDWTPPAPPEGKPEAVRLPPRPWGDPGRRLVAWAVVALTSIVALLFGEATSWGLAVIISALALAIWRGRFAWWENRVLPKAERLVSRVRATVSSR